MNCTQAMNDVPRHIPVLLRRARRLCRNEADARDLVQDACLHALEALRRAEAPPRNLRGWLVVVMRNIWFNALRHHRVRATVHAELATRPTVDDSLSQSRLVYDQFSRAWSQLPAQSRSIAERCLIVGDSQEEVSRRLGMTAGGVAASIHRTRAALRQSIL